MNVEIGTKAVQFPEKKYINGIFLAVQLTHIHKLTELLLTMRIQLTAPRK
jgi:hypothetical protein